MKKILFIILLGGAVITGLFLFYNQTYKRYFMGGGTTVLESSDYEKRNIVVGGKTVLVEVADTKAKQSLGLSGHKALADEEGMLFVFERADKYSFWMKEMLFPIDIIWIGEDFTIVDITENAEPASYPALFRPKQDALYVLEVNAGFSEKYRISIGDIIDFKQIRN